ncbi:Desert hedgehog protein B [Porphyridium purpureum]|uniref:Desert hedgehog protein B n=1 Tax=Porphyridium purpureum TaxID=35688 RepID=A0A5J4YWW3_PORPP|nr:Desert hedgehog protein B [Porphyridium purpureum]|eukprot:POR3096..scf209_3
MGGSLRCYGDMNTSSCNTCTADDQCTYAFAEGRFPTYCDVKTGCCRDGHSVEQFEAGERIECENKCSFGDAPCQSGFYCDDPAVLDQLGTGCCLPSTLSNLPRASGHAGSPCEFNSDCLEGYFCALHAKVCFPESRAGVQLAAKECFPSSAQVELANGTFLSMSHLEIGHEVRVSPTEFSEVLFWGHKDPERASSQYVSLFVGAGRPPLVISRDHLVYVQDELRKARDVGVGDVMVDGRTGERLTVVKVETGVKAKGLYSPHTRHGNIVVDGVLVSSYSAVAPGIAHALLAIERALRYTGVSLFGSLLEGETPHFLSVALDVFSTMKEYLKHACIV